MPEPLLSPKYRPRVAAFTGWTIFFFVLLRVGIGWHFLYEGVWKVKDGNFSATPYLLAAQGPLKPVFRWMVFDADGFKRMDPEFQIARMNEAYDRIIAHYKLKPDQQKVLDDWRKTSIEGLKSLGMSRAEIDKTKANAATHLHELFGQLGQNLESLSSAALSPETTLATAISRLEQSGSLALPVFDGQQFVGFIRSSDLKAATSQPAVAIEFVKLKETQLIVRDNDQVMGVVQALNADDYQKAKESYKQLLAQVAYEEATSDPKFKAQRLEFNQKKVTTARSALLARIEKPVTLMESVGDPVPPGLTRPQQGIPELSLTSEQAQAGPLPPAHLARFPGKLLNGRKLGPNIELRFPPKTLTFYIDLMMMFGLLAIGFCLIVGLFTRFAAFCGILMLAMFYFSMPPWPGTVDPPNVEGHYLVVNKNLIELLACLMIMSSHVGRWFGLDAFFGAIADRRRRKKAERQALQTPSSARDRAYIPGDGRGVREPARI